MFTSASLRLAAVLGLSAAALLPCRAADPDDARLQKLEDAVTALQKENAALKKEIEQGEPSAKAGPDMNPSLASAAKLKLSDSVTELRLYGEGRLRYFFNEGEAGGLDHGDHGDRDRLRYRLRLGADIKVKENWMLGVLVEENNVARSSNVTLGENPFFAKGTVSKTNFLTSIASSGSGIKVTGTDPATGKTVTGTAVTGLSSKTGSAVSNVNFGDALFLGRIFLKVDPAPWLTLEGGRIANPFTTTRMVWDIDLNPEGLAEQFHFTHGPVDYFANFGQFIYDDVGFENNFNTGTNQPFGQVPDHTDRWMLGWQLGARAHLNKDTYFQVAPAFYNYTGNGSGSAGPFNGDSPLVILNKKAEAQLITFNQTGTNDLAFIEVPFEFAMKVKGVPISIFGDFAYNFEADQRAAAAGHPDKSDGFAYQLGAGIGRNGHKGDWELRGWWQHSEAFALDQNIVDDDIFDGRLNMQGFYIQGSYNLTDAVSFIVQYSHAERIDSDLGTPGFGALGTAAGFPLQRSNLLYLDVNLKF